MYRTLVARQAHDGGMFVTVEAMTNFVASLGILWQDDRRHISSSTIRYQPQLRMSASQPQAKIDAVLAMLADAKSVPISSRRSALNRPQCGSIGGVTFTTECNISTTCH